MSFKFNLISKFIKCDIKNQHYFNDIMQRRFNFVAFPFADALLSCLHFFSKIFLTEFI